MYVTISIKKYHFQILFEGEVVADIYRGTGQLAEALGIHPGELFGKK